MRETITTIPFLPLGDTVIIEVKETTESGLILPEGSKEAAKSGEYTSVVAISSAFKYYDEINVGDRLLISGKLTGLVIAGKTYYIAESHQIKGVLQELDSNKTKN